MGKRDQMPVSVLSIVTMRERAHRAKRVRQICVVSIRAAWIDATRQMSKKSA
jgi:hypothetical protein